MKTTTKGISGAFALLLASAVHTFGVISNLQVQSTNLVLSWPSQGYEHYLVQYRPTLDSSTPWFSLTNNYPANSTNRTAFLIPCCTLNDLTGMSGGSFSGNQANSLGSAGEDDSYSNVDPRLWARPKDGSGDAVPLLIYPPSFDTNTLFIFERDWSPSESQTSGSSASANDTKSSGAMDGLSSGGCSCPDMAFFRVWEEPDFWFDYSQYTFRYGWEFLPIYWGNDVDPLRVTAVQLFVDGQEFPQAQFSLEQFDFGTPGNPDIEWTYGLWFPSDRLENGPHQLRFAATLHEMDFEGPTAPYLTLWSLNMPTTVTNPITFKPWKNLIIGTNHTFQAKTIYFPSSWEIDLYDAFGNWVTSATGTTANGDISWTWDLYDDSSILRDILEADPYFDPWVTVTYNTSAQSVIRPAPLSSLDYPYAGGWILAYQDADKFTPDARFWISQAWLGMAGQLSSKGVPNAPILLKYGKTNDVDMPSDPLDAMKQRNAGWDNLRATLLQGINRNFYYGGHGGPHRVGGDWDHLTNDASGLHVDSTDYDTNVYMDGTNQVRTVAYLNSGWCELLNPEYSDAPHPYRFVFLDACSSAATNSDWWHAFGMEYGPQEISFYTNTVRNPFTRPSAFVGWADTISYCEVLNHTSDGWGDYRKFANFRSEWFFNWVNNGLTAELSDALDLARQDSNWISPAKYQAIRRVYGYYHLRWNQYNSRNDWLPTQP